MLTRQTEHACRGRPPTLVMPCRVRRRRTRVLPTCPSAAAARAALAAATLAAAAHAAAALAAASEPASIAAAALSILP